MDIGETRPLSEHHTQSEEAGTTSTGAEGQGSESESCQSEHKVCGSISTANPYSHLPEAERRKVETLLRKKTELEATISHMEGERDELSQSLIEKDAVLTVKSHIRLLHKYNEIKDVGMGLLSMIAEQRGVPVKDVMQEFGLDKKD